MSVCFIHVPRTAGTAVRRWAMNNIPDFVDLGPRSRIRSWARIRHRFDPNARMVGLGHIPAAWLIERGVFTREWYDSAWKFGCVRNTYERLVSFFEFLRSQKFRRTRGHWSNRHLLMFDDFIRRNVTGVEEDGWPRFCCRQLPFLADGVDCVLRFERLDEDFMRVREKIGVDVPLGHRNKVRAWKDMRERLAGGDWRKYYTPELVDLVADFYADEIERFGFRFE